MNYFHPIPEAACQLEKDPGPCRAAIRRFYYDVRRSKCKPFVYGGCDGNENNFESKDACQSACESDGM